MMRVAILGASGYLGRSYMQAQPPIGVALIPAIRAMIDYTDAVLFKEFLKREKIDKVINCAGFTGKPNVDACEDSRELCFSLNVRLPEVLATVCADEKKSFYQIGSGCIYQGVPDLRHPNQGFKELDEPNFCFKHPPCSFYSGTKAEMEERIGKIPGISIWRLRMPFSGKHDDRNLLVKLANYRKILEARNSITFLEEFIEKTLKMAAAGVPEGIYNLTNPGIALNSEIINLLLLKKIRLTPPIYFQSREEISLAMRSPRSSCLLDSGKVAEVGFEFQDVHGALRKCAQALLVGGE